MSDLVNKHLGRRLRSRRRIMALTQADVARTCGIGFQRVHKYESAANSISAAMLWKLSTALGVDIQYFFEGLSQTPDTPAAE